MVSNRVRQGGSFKTRARTVFRDIGRNPSIADAPSLVACYFSCHLHLLSVARYLCPCYLPSSPADCFSYPSLAVARHLPGCTLPAFCPLTHRPIACYQLFPVGCYLKLPLVTCYQLFVACSLLPSLVVRCLSFVTRHLRLSLACRCLSFDLLPAVSTRRPREVSVVRVRS